MSSAITAAKRRRPLLLASSLLVSNFLASSFLALTVSLAAAKPPSAGQLPPVDVNPPTDQNRTRAKPVTDEGTGTRRVVRPAPTNTGAAPSDGSGASSSGGTGSGGTAVRQFNGIVGASSTVITADDI